VRLSRLELRVMEALWTAGPASVREVRDAIPAPRRPAYTTVQTMVYRLEAKGALRRVKKIGNAHVFEASISRGAAQQTLIDDLLNAFGGSVQPVMAHFVDSGRLTQADLDTARKRLRELAKAPAAKKRGR